MATKSTAEGYTPKANDLVTADGKIYINGKLPRVEKRVTVNIPREHGKREQEDVNLTINGKTIQIQRGVNVEIPESYAKLLENMEEARAEADKFYFDNAN